jgi:hypothetical protein
MQKALISGGNVRLGAEILNMGEGFMLFGTSP